MIPGDKTSRIERQIDENLKRAYDKVAQEQLPSRLTDLLEQLRAQDAAVLPQEGKDD